MASGSSPKAERVLLYVSVLGLDPGTHKAGQRVKRAYPSAFACL